MEATATLNSLNIKTFLIIGKNCTSIMPELKCVAQKSSKKDWK